jgi:glycosyltransferase involved in cell wall biosynthesis
VVLPGYWDPAFWVLLALAKVEGRKVVLSFDSTKLDHTRHTLLELAKKVFVALCDAGFAYGHRARRYLRELGMPVDRIVIRCQATANEEIRVEFEAAFRERADLLALYGLPARNFCFVGRLSSEKNVLLLIQALESLQVSTQASEGWGLCVVGDGPERPNIEAYCAERRLRAVKFFGGVSWREIPRYLAISDVLVLPSISEPWGLVVNEAMVCGLPVIVSENCGCVEDLVIEGRTGFSFDPHSCANLVKHMRHFVNSPSEIRRIGDAGAHLIRDFSPQAAARQMLSGLNGLLPPE